MDHQVELEILIKNLNRDYNPRNLKKIEEKNKVLKSAKKLFDARKDISVFFFKKDFFCIKVMYLKQKKKNQTKQIK